MARVSVEDLTTLQMALVGYQIERKKIEEKINQLQSELKGQRFVASPVAGQEAAPRAKRTLSASARRRIAAAQKKRWAEHRKRVAQAAKAE